MNRNIKRRKRQGAPLHGGVQRRKYFDTRHKYCEPIPSAPNAKLMVKIKPSAHSNRLKKRENADPDIDGIKTAKESCAKELEPTKEGSTEHQNGTPDHTGQIASQVVINITPPATSSLDSKVNTAVNSKKQVSNPLSGSDRKIKDICKALSIVMISNFSERVRRELPELISAPVVENAKEKDARIMSEWRKRGDEVAKDYLIQLDVIAQLLVEVQEHERYGRIRQKVRTERKVNKEKLDLQALETDLKGLDVVTSPTEDHSIALWLIDSPASRMKWMENKLSENKQRKTCTVPWTPSEEEIASAGKIGVHLEGSGYDEHRRQYVMDDIKRSLNIKDGTCVYPRIMNIYPINKIVVDVICCYNTTRGAKRCKKLGMTRIEGTTRYKRNVEEVTSYHFIGSFPQHVIRSKVGTKPCTNEVLKWRKEDNTSADVTYNIGHNGTPHLIKIVEQGVTYRKAVKPVYSDAPQGRMPIYEKVEGRLSKNALLSKLFTGKVRIQQWLRWTDTAPESNDYRFLELVFDKQIPDPIQFPEFTGIPIEVGKHCRIIGTRISHTSGDDFLRMDTQVFSIPRKFILQVMNLGGNSEVASTAYTAWAAIVQRILQDEYWKSHMSHPMIQAASVGITWYCMMRSAVKMIDGAPGEKQKKILGRGSEIMSGKAVRDYTYLWWRPLIPFVSYFFILRCLFIKYNFWTSRCAVGGVVLNPIKKFKKSIQDIWWLMLLEILVATYLLFNIGAVIAAVLAVWWWGVVQVVKFWPEGIDFLSSLGGALNHMVKLGAVKLANYTASHPL